MKAFVLTLAARLGRRGRGSRGAAAPALALAALALFAFAASARAAELETLTIRTATGDHAFKVEIAADEASREKGLMYRRSMPADHGMLFEFDFDAPVAFWMKNTYIPLDMLFIARDGKVTHIARNAEPMSETAIPSEGPAAGVLEVNAGVASLIGVRVGDQVVHPFFKP